MAYSSQDAANTILRLKKNWLKADEQNDTTQKNQIANDAQTYYSQMRNNGDTRLANTLYDSGYEKSKQYVNDYFAEQGKSAIRPYFYELGKSYNLSNKDIDDALSYNSITGEVSLGGKNIGKPSGISSNGVSYWDNATLDNAFNDYVTRTGKSKSNDNVIGTMQDSMAKGYNDLKDTSFKDYNDYMDLVKQNPYDTDEGKAIMGKYDLAALQGRNNQLAMGTASNGGNVDSYSAANAMRQQAALYSQGQQAVLDMYNSRVQNAYNSSDKLANIRQTLSDMGVQINDAFQRNETAKNNEVERNETTLNGQVARDAQIAEVTGKVPTRMSVTSQNMFFNEDGTLKDDSIDYAYVIEQANKNGDEETAKQAKVARAYKIFNDYSKWGKYDDGNYSAPVQNQTEYGRQFDEQIKNSVDLAKMGYENSENELKAEQQHEKDMANINTDNTIREENAKTDNSIREENAKGDNTIRLKNNGISENGSSEVSSGSSDTAWENNESENTADTPESDWERFMGYFSEDNEKNEKIKNFLTAQLKPYYDNNWEINEEVLEKLIVGTDAKNSNSTKYDIDVTDAKNICNALGLSSDWVDKYKNRSVFNAGKGMKATK